MLENEAMSQSPSDFPVALGQLNTGVFSLVVFPTNQTIP